MFNSKSNTVWNIDSGIWKKLKISKFGSILMAVQKIKRRYENQWKCSCP